MDKLDVAMDTHASRQCAAAVLNRIPKNMRDLVEFEVGLQAGIFPILGALYYPHLGDDTVERQILEDTQLVTGTGPHKQGPFHRHEVYAAPYQDHYSDEEAYCGSSASFGPQQEARVGGCGLTMWL